MSQYQMAKLALEIMLPADLLSVLVWVGYYTWQARWWKLTFGRTLMAKDGLIAALLAASALPLFAHLEPSARIYLDWTDVGLVFLVTPAMWWRIIASAAFTPADRSLRRSAAAWAANMRRWWRERRDRKKGRDGAD